MQLYPIKPNSKLSSKQRHYRARIAKRIRSPPQRHQPLPKMQKTGLLTQIETYHLQKDVEQHEPDTKATETAKRSLVPLPEQHASDAANETLAAELLRLKGVECELKGRLQTELSDMRTELKVQKEAYKRLNLESNEKTLQWNAERHEFRIECRALSAELEAREEENAELRQQLESREEENAELRHSILNSGFQQLEAREKLSSKDSCDNTPEIDTGSDEEEEEHSNEEIVRILFQILYRTEDANLRHQLSGLEKQLLSSMQLGTLDGLIAEYQQAQHTDAGEYDRTEVGISVLPPGGWHSMTLLERQQMHENVKAFKLKEMRQQQQNAQSLQ